jgi:hypothetical protein
MDECDVIVERERERERERVWGECAKEIASRESVCMGIGQLVGFEGVSTIRRG